MKQIDFNVGASRRDLLKTMAVAGAGALVPWESSMAQGAKKGTGKIDVHQDRKSTRLNSSHIPLSRMPPSA